MAMRSPQQKKTQTFTGPGLSRNDACACKSFLAKDRRPVNTSALFFYLLSVTGLSLAGGWAERSVIWLPTLDMAAKLLREVVGGCV